MDITRAKQIAGVLTESVHDAHKASALRHAIRLLYQAEDVVREALGPSESIPLRDTIMDAIEEVRLMVDQLEQ